MLFIFHLQTSANKSQIVLVILMYWITWNHYVTVELMRKHSWFLCWKDGFNLTRLNISYYLKMCMADICWPAMLSCKVTRQILLNTYSWTNVQLQFSSTGIMKLVIKFTKKMRSYFSCIPNKKTVNFIDVENVITYQTEYTVLVYPRSMHCDDISGWGHR